MENKYLRKKCRTAIKNIIKEGITDVEIFNRPFELDLLKNKDIEKKIIDFVVGAIQSKKFDNLKMHKLSHVLVPKKSLCDFRKCALIDVVDEIIYLTLALCLIEKIESARINKSKNKIFSYRFHLNNDYIFDSNYHFTSFRQEVERKKRLSKNKVMVECDISNFYDRVNLHRINSALLSLDKINMDIVKLLDNILLFWANRDSYGLPVGSNASRILAEVALLNVDTILEESKVDFCRFVDDYRIFAKDAKTAHSNLSLLVQCLNREGLFINIQKTNMKDISEVKKIKEEIEEKKSEDKLPEIKKTKALIDDKKIEMPKVIRGYSGLVPTKFRKITLEESKKLKLNNLKFLCENTKKQILIEPKELTKTIRTIMAQEKYKYLSEISLSLKKFPQLIPYFVDGISKYYNFIDKEIVENIKVNFKELYKEEDIPEYVLIYLVRLFNFEKSNEKDKDILFSKFRNLKRVEGSYIGRALLEALFNRLNRIEVLQIKEYYVRADMWEKRQIIRLIRSKLSEGEKGAFFKDVQIHNRDIFIEYLATNKKIKY